MSNHEDYGLGQLNALSEGLLLLPGAAPSLRLIFSGFPYLVSYRSNTTTFGVLSRPCFLLSHAAC